MPIPSGASIKLLGEGYQWEFGWSGFDLDDCFDLFRISVKQGEVNEQFDFGPCVVRDLRKLTRFFDDNKDEDGVGGGFRNPDIRLYELRRHSGEYKLAISFEGRGLKKEFVVGGGEALIDRKFLNAYEDREA